MSRRADIGEEVLRLIRQIVRRITEHSKHLSREHGLTVPQLICFKTIVELEQAKEDVTVIKVASAVGLTPATTSRIIDKLEQKQLVQRERRSSDRRKVFLVLTAKGIERSVLLPTLLQEQFVQRIEGLSSKDQKRILATLESIVTMMDAQDIDAAPLLVPNIPVKEADSDG